MRFKQHCFKGEGVLFFVYSANHKKCSKTFGRHCRFAVSFSCMNEAQEELIMGYTKFGISDCAGIFN